LPHRNADAAGGYQLYRSRHPVVLQPDRLIGLAAVIWIRLARRWRAPRSSARRRQAPGMPSGPTSAGRAGSPRPPTTWPASGRDQGAAPSSPRLGLQQTARPGVSPHRVAAAGAARPCQNQPVGRMRRQERPGGLAELPRRLADSVVSAVLPARAPQRVEPGPSFLGTQHPDQPRPAGPSAETRPTPHLPASQAPRRPSAGNGTAPRTASTFRRSDTSPAPSSCSLKDGRAALPVLGRGRTATRSRPSAAASGRAAFPTRIP
jgi:hypothetical protein